MSEQVNRNDGRLVPAGRHNVVPVVDANPLVSRGIADLIQGLTPEKVRSQPPDSDNRALTSQFSTEMRGVEFPIEGDTFALPIPLTQVGDRLYRVEGMPWCLFPIVDIVGYFDIIELAPPVEDGDFRFVRITEQSGWRTYGPYTIPEKVWFKSIEEGKPWPPQLEELKAQGGYWEATSGQLCIFLPSGFDLDQTPWITTKRVTLWEADDI